MNKNKTILKLKLTTIDIDWNEINEKNYFDEKEI